MAEVQVGDRVRDKTTGLLGTLMPCAEDDDGSLDVRLDSKPTTKLHYSGFEERYELVELEKKLALAGLENELAEVRRQIVELEHTHTRLEKQAAQLKTFLPPFEKGQKVKAPAGGKLVVDDVAQAFGGWVVLGHFPGSSQPYTYPASVLEAA